MNDMLRVGTWEIPYRDAQQNLEEYTRGGTPKAPYAYPAYDDYPGSGHEYIDVQDLFAPSLLSVPMRSLRTFYELQDAISVLNARLRDLDHAVRTEEKEISLAHINDDSLTRVAALFGILDQDRPYGVQLTTLSKLLHKKRPNLLPIWDRYVEDCYGDDKRIIASGKRTREDFVARWLGALREDLATSLDQWNTLTTLVPQEGPSITALRALDIVVWMSGKQRTFSASSTNKPR